MKDSKNEIINWSKNSILKVKIIISEMTCNFSIFGKFEKEASCCLPVLIETASLSLEFQKNLTQQDWFRKEDRSPVTVYDYVLQTYLVDAITSQFPEDPIIAEESLDGDIDPKFISKIEETIKHKKFDLKKIFGKVSSCAPSKIGRFWVIDPIDGTSGFKRKDGQFCIAIALIENNESVFSAVAWPTQIPSLSGMLKAEPLFLLAARGHGSYYSTSSDPFNLNLVKVPQNLNDINNRQILPHGTRNENRMKKIAKNLNIPYSPIVCTSMCKGFSIAFGAASYYIRAPFSDIEKNYDIAPFSMFVEEAGGIATLGDGKKINFSNDGYVHGSECGFLFSILGEQFHKKLVKEYSEAFELDLIE
ncbi:Inositol monophosphatase family protein [Tritrichomonas foetus]|uniref:Inositol monophosphatase family protein n=1 Tax=Tritrichomonas foetus TaxID=1144522 RepID=A0A1J4JDE3_9EUKA|nr:Inositol monophosphatase family protein [Tritrichomonas foetus]|eukprot:OHS95284.1 Inositol monophosphatase family protein [Tritrichomonas foetus]